MVYFQSFPPASQISVEHFAALSSMTCAVLVGPETFRHDPYASPVLSTNCDMTTNAPSSSCSTVLKHPLLLRIRFKRTLAYFVSSFDAVPGQYVVVEGDRGNDIGMVESCELLGFHSANHTHKHAVRIATVEDLAAMEGLRDYEVNSVIPLVNQRVVECGLEDDMKIEDVSYQFDCQKVTVFFKPLKPSVDFRHLQRVLYKDFRCRLWIQNL